MIIPDAPMEGDERVEFHDDDGKLVGIADVGVGDPTNPYHGQLLSVDDEKRLDSRGAEVVKGLPWSQANTGLWFTIASGAGEIKSDIPPHCGTSMSIPQRVVSGADARLFVGIFRDYKPKFSTPVYGAAIELPSDLGGDEIKRKYITEWIAHTTVEAVSGLGVTFDMNDPKLGHEFVKMATMVTWAAEDAIRESGL
tara:strand:- start:292 stop:879 length:588 start_codon:yes stop_codon:yes gene_type:complete